MQDDYSQIIAALATTHREFEGPHGQISLFMPERGWVSWTSPDTPLKLHEALTLGNIRAVLGNYVTVTPSRYVLPLMLLTLCSAIAAIGVVILTRRRKP